MNKNLFNKEKWYMKLTSKMFKNNKNKNNKIN